MLPCFCLKHQNLTNKFRKEGMGVDFEPNWAWVIEIFQNMELQEKEA